MKNLRIITVTLLISLSLSSLMYPQNRRLEKLKTLLNPSPDQIQIIEKALKVEKSQKALDMKNYSETPLALLHAATRRENMINTLIMSCLTPAQKKNLSEHNEHSGKKRDIFIWQESLSMSREQVIKLREIINRRESANYKGSIMHNRKRKNIGNVRYRKSGRINQSHTEREKEENSILINNTEEIAVKKSKQIFKILSPEQKKYFKEIKKYYINECKKRTRKKLKEKRAAH